MQTFLSAALVGFIALTLCFNLTSMIFPNAVERFVGRFFALNVGKKHKASENRDSLRIPIFPIQVFFVTSLVLVLVLNVAMIFLT